MTDDPVTLTEGDADRRWTAVLSARCSHRSMAVI